MNKISQIIKDSKGIWVTQNDFFVWLRGSLRRIWNRHPIKITYKTSKSYPVPAHQKEQWGRTKLLIDCEVCETPTPKSRAEVDHKVEAGSLKTMEDVLQFIYRLLFISWEDIRCLCHECHATTTYAARFGLTFQDAKLEREVIAFGKKPTSDQKKILLTLGLIAGKSNAKERKEYYRKYLRKQQL